jgi:glycosyltransferase involved in cell wall biosynthesis
LQSMHLICIQMPSKKLHIFFIASWLPSLHDAFEGDFILRHAQAAALLHKVTLVFAIETDVIGNVDCQIETTTEGNLTTHKIYLHAKYKSVFRKNKYYIEIEKLFVAQHKINKIDLIHANVHWRAGYSAYLIHRKHKVPYVISEHSAYFNTNYYTRLSVASYSVLKKIITKIVLRKAAMVMPVSNYLSYWIKKFVPTTICTTVSNVVDDELFYYMPAPSNQAFIFLHASMGWAEKNIQMMIDAVRILSLQNQQFELHLYTPITEELKYAVQSNQLHAYIKLKGIIQHTDMPAAIQQSNATILYSNMETQGCILLESICCGRPIIAGCAPVFTETVTATNGFANNYNSAENLMQLMHRMIANYKEFDQEQISKDAIAKYGMRAIANRFNDVYNMVLKVV